MKNLQDMLSKANFAKETDLKDRLRSQLFGSDESRIRPGVTALDDDDLDMVAAAGVPELPIGMDQEKNNRQERR